MGWLTIVAIGLWGINFNTRLSSETIFSASAYSAVEKMGCTLSPVPMLFGNLQYVVLLLIALGAFLSGHGLSRGPIRD
jgi:hypothetical protein